MARQHSLCGAGAGSNLHSPEIVENAPWRAIRVGAGDRSAVLA
jgi:hypothetical protein